MPVMAPPSRWLTRDEAAAYLKVNARQLNRLAAQGKIKKHYVSGPRTVRFDIHELDALLLESSQPKIKSDKDETG